MVAIALYDVFIMFEYVIGLGLIGIGSNRIGRQVLKRCFEIVIVVCSLFLFAFYETNEVQE